MPMSNMKIHITASFRREAEAIAFALENEASVACFAYPEK